MFGFYVRCDDVKWDECERAVCTIFVIRVDVKLMAVSVNLSLFPFNGAIYNFYEAVYFPPYMTTFDSENKHNFDTQITN